MKVYFNSERAGLCLARHTGYDDGDRYMLTIEHDDDGREASVIALSPLELHELAVAFLAAAHDAQLAPRAGQSILS